MIDLHMHTNYSDGSSSLEELLNLAENKGLELISITDHDKVNVYYELEGNKELRNTFSGEIITGCEYKAMYESVGIEILAYGFDYKKLKLNKIDNYELQKNSINFYIEIMKNMGLKFDKNELYIDMDNPMRKWGSFVIVNEILRYPENKEILDKLGGISLHDFYRLHVSNRNSPFYFDESRFFPDINTAISNIHDAGGLAFLAHPYVYYFEDKTKTLEDILKNTDIDGVECWYPLFDTEKRESIKKLAKKYNKFLCGGTDYHGVCKPNIELGSGIDNNVCVMRADVAGWLEKIARA